MANYIASIQSAFVPVCALKWRRSYEITSFFSNGQAVLLLSTPEPQTEFCLPSTGT